MGFAEKLGLSDEQRDQMREMKVTFRNQTRKSRINLMSLKDEKRTMIMSAKIDQKKLKELDDAIVKAKSEVQTARLKMRRDRLSLLTPEQLKKLADLTEKRSHRRGHRGFHGKRWGRRF
jgi:Spy/CpxP family protein refolding chaperone